MDLKEAEILGADAAAHWYYRSKARAIRSLLGDSVPATVLDVGAGSGFFSKYLLSSTEAVEAWCVDIGYASDTEGEEQGKPVHYRRTIEGVDAGLVLLIDVLEHVDDDVGLLSDYSHRVPSGARFLISVPAFPLLWSGHDDFLEHKRRYRLTEIEAVAGRAGLRVEHSAYYFGLVFPIAATLRLAQRWLGSRRGHPRSQLQRHGRLTNAVLEAVCRAELPFLSFNRLAGLTLFCIAQGQ